MRRLLPTLLLILALFTGSAAVDLGNGVCEQDGVLGVWNGTSADADGCVTVAEYDVMFPGQLDTSTAVGPGPEQATTVREWFDAALDQRFGPR